MKTECAQLHFYEHTSYLVSEFSEFSNLLSRQELLIYRYAREKLCQYFESYARILKPLAKYFEADAFPRSVIGGQCCLTFPASASTLTQLQKVIAWQV